MRLFYKPTKKAVEASTEERAWNAINEERIVTVKCLDYKYDKDKFPTEGYRCQLSDSCCNSQNQKVEDDWSARIGIKRMINRDQFGRSYCDGDFYKCSVCKKDFLSLVAAYYHSKNSHGAKQKEEVVDGDNNNEV